MFPSACSAVLLFALSSAPSVSAGTPEAGDSVQPARDSRVDVRLFDLAAVRRLFHALARRGDVMSEGERAAALTDFSVMSEAVVGGSAGGPFSFDELVSDATGGGPHVSAAPGVGGRAASSSRASTSAERRAHA